MEVRSECPSVRHSFAFLGPGISPEGRRWPIRSIVGLLAVWLCLSQLAYSKERKVTGFVTGISPDKTAIEIWQNRISLPKGLEVQIKDNERSLEFNRNDLRIGMLVQVAGEYETDKYQLTARKLSIDADQFEKEIKRTAYLHRPIESLAKGGDGWTGTLFLDGQRVRIQPKTEVVFKLNREEEKIADKIEKAEKENEDFDDSDLEEVANFQPLKSIEEVRVGDICEYTGFRNEDGSVTATKLAFQKNALERNEEKLYRKLKLKEKEFNENDAKRGEVKVGRYKFKTYYSKDLQEYVSRLGHSLVPEYQQGLPEGDPRKIDFRFYVIDGERSPNAFAFPNGIIGINTAMLLMLENEAQLAAVLGHEIAHVINEHTYRQLMFHRKKRFALGAAKIAAYAFGFGTVGDILQLTEAAITNGYQRFLEEQSDRCGLTFVAERGYNPLQSVQVWINVTRNFGDAPTNFFWSSHPSHTERISYLLFEVRNAFPDKTNVDFVQMELGSQPYLQATEGLRQDPKLEKLRKRMMEHREKFDREERLLKF